jgi:hypothetical protein
MSQRSRFGPERSGEYPRTPLEFGLAALESGELLDCALAGEARSRLEGLTATLPELMEAFDERSRKRLAAALGGEPMGASYSELVLVSVAHVYVVQPLEKREGLALVSVSPTTSSMGKILSDVHAAIGELDAE